MQKFLEGLIFKVADSHERGEALALRKRIYTAELGSTGQDPFDEVAYHLIARDSNGRVVASLRIVGQEHRPFDIEHLVNISPFLPPGKIPGEISRFCVDPQYRQIHHGQLIHLGVLKLVYEFCFSKGLTDLFTLVMPHLVGLYESVFFNSPDVTCDHPTFGSAQLMHLDLVDVRCRYRNAQNSVARLLFRTTIPNIVL